MYQETLRWSATDVHLIAGQAEVSQAGQTFAGARMAVFVTETNEGFDTAIYAEDLTITDRNGQRSTGALSFRLESTGVPVFDVRESTAAETADQPLLRRALGAAVSGQSGRAASGIDAVAIGCVFSPGPGGSAGGGIGFAACADSPAIE